MRVNVYFRLLLEALHAGIEIDYITFDEGSADPDENTQRLVEAIANARLAPVRGAQRGKTAPSKEEPKSGAPSRRRAQALDSGRASPL